MSAAHMGHNRALRSPAPPHKQRTEHAYIHFQKAETEAAVGQTGRQEAGNARPPERREAGERRRRVRRVQRICGFGRAFAGPTDLAANGSSGVALHDQPLLDRDAMNERVV